MSPRSSLREGLFCCLLVVATVGCKRSERTSQPPSPAQVTSVDAASSFADSRYPLHRGDPNSPSIFEALLGLDPRSPGYCLALAAAVQGPDGINACDSDDDCLVTDNCLVLDRRDRDVEHVSFAIAKRNCSRRLAPCPGTIAYCHRGRCKP